MAVCQARTFTTLVENGQSVVAVTSVIIALVLNTVILVQVLSTSLSTPPPVLLTEKKFQHHSLLFTKTHNKETFFRDIFSRCTGHIDPKFYRRRKSES